MSLNENFHKIGALLKKERAMPPPAYPWQELALEIIKELNVPKSKKTAVFKVCRDHQRSFIERCLNDTKELSHRERWKYFF